MRRIIAVAVNTFREAVRDRVLYGLLGVGVTVVAMSFFLAELSLDQQERVMLDVGLASISIFSVVTAIFLGSSLLYKEIERKTLYVILPKAVARHEFLLGKFFGIVLTVFVFVNIMGAIQTEMKALSGKSGNFAPTRFRRSRDWWGMDHVDDRQDETPVTTTGIEARYLVEYGSA